MSAEERQISLEVFLLLAAALAALAAGVVAYRRRQERQREREQARRPRPRQDPFGDLHGNERALYALKVGDLVQYHNREWWVRGTLRFDEHGTSWQEHLISDFSEQHWLSVAEDEGIDLALWDRVPPGDVRGNAGDGTVSYGDTVYKLSEHGEATFKAEGTTGTGPQGLARYADYEGADGKLLSMERFGEQWEVSLGRKVAPMAFEIYPVSE